MDFFSNFFILFLQYGVDLQNPEVHKDIRMRVYDTATRFKDDKFIHHRKFFVSYIAKGQANSQHFPLYLNYFKKHSCDKEINAADFEDVCGIGKVYSAEEVQKAVNDVLDSKKSKLETDKWAFGYPQALGELKKILAFADSAVILSALDGELEKRLGPKPKAEDIKSAAKQKIKQEKATAPKAAPKQEEKKEEEAAYETLRDSVQFPDPSENIQLTPELLAEHLKITGGKVRTRFPPEPNVHPFSSLPFFLSPSFSLITIISIICRDIYILDTPNP